MTIEELKHYAPQKVFLLQGTDTSFADFLEDAKRTAPLVHALAVPRFTLSHARDVATFALEGDGTSRMFLIYFSVFSPEAAQLLLKSLEEPDTNTTIVFMTPYPYAIPSTIRSRVMLLQTTRDSVVPHAISAASASAFIKTHLSGENDEDAATRRAKAIAFLDELEVFFKKNASKSSVVYEAKDMLFSANIPAKYAVEYAVSTLF